MKDERVPVYGKDAEGNRKRGFDWLMIDGKPYIESVTREGHKVKTPAYEAANAFKELQEKCQQHG